MDERTKYQEGVWVLNFLRTLGTEEQRIAYAVLEGMRLQRDLDSQKQSQSQAQAQPSA